MTPEYCAFADELNIKIAQGSKPGEGGQLPGHKVSGEIARLRHTQPGVGLISPPPHHDIYSIEDLAQLIYDLKQVNPLAEVSVKLVAEDGVGTIAAGVVKALADVVQISGSNGGTGASPLSSIKNAGMPWELGLAETQQALIENGLRDRVRVRVDGGFKTGRDVVIAALLGADEYSFGTAAMLAEGCIMVRACHRDTCPTGIATQRPNLRAKFAGTPEGVATYMLFVAEEVRRTAGVARACAASTRRSGASTCSASGRPATRVPTRSTRRRSSRRRSDAEAPRHFVADVPIQRPRSALDERLLADGVRRAVGAAATSSSSTRSPTPTARSARRSAARSGSSGASGLPPGSVTARLHRRGRAELRRVPRRRRRARAGRRGERLPRQGDGRRPRRSVRPPEGDAGDAVLAGNTVLYGATGGQVFIAGRVGERFMVRNSGATAVVEGTGDHACEYMTGGTCVDPRPVRLQPRRRHDRRTGVRVRSRRARSRRG